MILKVWPGLGLAALRLRRDRELRLWTLARAWDITGSGRLRLETLRVLAGAHRWRGLSERSIRRLLASGEGVWWVLHRDRYGAEWVYLAGLALVCERLDVDRLRKAPALIPVRCGVTLRSWRAAVYAAQFGQDYGAPISRRVLEELSGASDNSQRRYERAAGVEVRGNATRTGLAWRGERPERPCPLFAARLGGRWQVLRRLPNCYKADYLRAARGMTRSVNRRLRGGHPPAMGDGGNGRERNRLFYRDAKRADKRSHRLEDCGLLWLETARRTAEGLSLWDTCQAVNGGLEWV